MLETKTATQAFYEQMEQMRPHLPTDWKAQFLKRYPHYDNSKGIVLLNNVVHGQSTDVLVLELLKKLVKRKSTKKLTTKK